MKTLICLALLLNAGIVLAKDSCREESLVHFFSEKAEVASELIGVDDPCDGFGGNLIYSPKNNLFLYVNFNISGNIDLDVLDESFDQYANPEAREWLKSIQLAVITGPAMLDLYGLERDAVLNQWGDTLFIHEKLLQGNGLPRLWKEFYNLSNSRLMLK